MSASKLAKRINCPSAYLSQVLAKLKKPGIIISKRGLNGGVSLAKAASSISIYEVINAIDGDKFFKSCFLGGPECSETTPCPFHGFWSVERERIKDYLVNTSFADIYQNATENWFDLRLGHIK